MIRIEISFGSTRVKVDFPNHQGRDAARFVAELFRESSGDKATEIAVPEIVLPIGNTDPMWSNTA